MARVAYCATKDVFIQDVVFNRFIPKMKQGALLNHIGAGSSEILSWQNNAPKVRDLLDISHVPDSVIVSFEYKVPNGGRIDCMLYGVGENDKQNVVHIELKQWSNETVRELYDNGVFRVDALTGGAFRPVCHPSQQVANYQTHLLNFVEELNRSDTTLSGLAYCYNYNSSMNPHALYADHYRTIIDEHHLYSGNELEALSFRIHELLSKGSGLEIFNRVSKSRIRQSEKLLDAAAGMFEGISAFSLLDDQITASKAIFAEVKKDITAEEKQHLNYKDKFIEADVFQWECEDYRASRWSDSKILEEHKKLTNSKEAFLFIRKVDNEHGIQMPFIYVGTGKMTNPVNTEKNDPCSTLIYKIKMNNPLPDDLQYDFELSKNLFS